MGSYNTMASYWLSRNTPTERYWLDRCWDPLLPSRMLAWCMLNPSTATQEQLDPTLRRCLSFSQREHYTGFVVVNLWPLRDTDPGGLANYHPSDAEAATRVILDAARYCDDMVVGWGNHGRLRNRGAEVLAALRDEGIDPLCLGLTGERHPLHPLYVPAGREFTRYLCPFCAAKGAT